MSGRPVPISCGVLVYRSRDWLTFVLDGLCGAMNVRTQPVLHVVANDPTPEIANDLRVHLTFHNTDPDEYYLRRVYRAWNFVVETARTELVVLLNSDMFVADYWLDELYEIYEKADHRAVVTSLLVESGRIPSALPEYVKNFGETPRTFDHAGWKAHANSLRTGCQGHWRPGELYMPVLLSKTAWREAGGYPIGNVAGAGTGDRLFFEYLAAVGYEHRMAMGSLCYHSQEGEMRDGG